MRRSHHFFTKLSDSSRRFELRSETLALARSVPAVAFFLFKKKLTSGAAAPDCRILFLPQIPPSRHEVPVLHGVAPHLFFQKKSVQEERWLFCKGRILEWHRALRRKLQNKVFQVHGFAFQAIFCCTSNSIIDQVKCMPACVRSL